MNKLFDRHINNFNLIRLIAAIQVCLTHTLHYMEIHNEITKFISAIPGVPIFFFISGILVSNSYKHSPSLASFYWKRILRIYPAIVFSVGIISLGLAISFIYLPLREYLIWILSQITVVQFYSPPSLSNFGIGVINGSLWTVAVELQFYLLTPALCWIQKNRNRYLLLLFILSVIANLFSLNLNESLPSIISKVLLVSFVPWLYMFLLGLGFTEYLSVKSFKKMNNNYHFLPVILLTLFLGIEIILGEGGNKIPPISFAIYAFLALKLATAFPGLSYKLLGKNDYSYGTYVFHMPVINFLIYIGHKGVSGSILTIICTIFSAVVSWNLIEKPALKLKELNVS